MIRAPFDNLRVHSPGAGFARPAPDLVGQLARDLLVADVSGLSAALVVAGVGAWCPLFLMLVGG